VRVLGLEQERGLGEIVVFSSSDRFDMKYMI
jgi:hypothetical protein